MSGGSRLVLFLAILRTDSAGEALLAQSPSDDPKPRAEAPSFLALVRPILDSRCLRCHDAKVHKAELDLSTYASILKGGESGPVVVPGKPEESPLYQMVRDGAMPADKQQKPSAEQTETLRLWIEAGAPSGSEGPTERGPGDSEPVNQHNVYPILLRRCVVCHGRDVRENGLDLRTRAAMFQGGKSGPAFVPGHPEQSLILEKVRSGAMPPRRRLIEASVKPMDPAEIETITRWIALGEIQIAPDVATTDPDSLVTDKDQRSGRSSRPDAATPSTPRHAVQVRNPIDAFVLENSNRRDLNWPEADRPTLLRRLALDLTGLPPDLETLESFLADRDPNAYEKLVDRLLASPRHGERWGRHWLDMAGYAEQKARREQDLPRPFAWRTRDYVVRSLNADKSYDRSCSNRSPGQLRTTARPCHYSRTRRQPRRDRFLGGPRPNLGQSNELCTRPSGHHR